MFDQDPCISHLLVVISCRLIVGNRCRGPKSIGSFFHLTRKPSFLTLLKGGSLGCYRITFLYLLDCGDVVRSRRYFKFENM